MAKSNTDILKNFLCFLKEARVLSEKERTKNNISLKEYKAWNCQYLIFLIEKLLNDNTLSFNKLLHPAILAILELDEWNGFLDENGGSDSEVLNNFIDENHELLDEVQDLEWEF